MIHQTLLLLGLLSSNNVLARPTANNSSAANPALQNCYDYVRAVCSGSDNPPDHTQCDEYLEYMYLGYTWFDCSAGEYFDPVSAACEIWNNNGANGTTTNTGNTTDTAGTTNTTTSTTTIMKSKRQTDDSGSADLANCYIACLSADSGLTVTVEQIEFSIAVAGVTSCEPGWGTLFAAAIQGNDVKNITVSGGNSTATNVTRV